jgi:D-glycero-alpha-D-manno-heptose 1-phosphate guanylyltransferase
MEAIILAGGLGTRLASVVSDMPKCMAPVAGKPFLHWIVAQLKKEGITHFVFSVGHKKEAIIEWASQNLKAAEYKICIEENPLGTGGGIQTALHCCNTENVFAINGDTYYDINFSTQMQWHNAHNALCTLALKPMVFFERYGTVAVDDKSIINAFEEKKFTTSGLINGGIYCINKAKFLEQNLPEKFSFETEFLLPNADKQNLYSVVNDGYFIDIGIPEDFAIANQHFALL